MNIFMIDLSTGSTIELPRSQQTYMTIVTAGEITLISRPASQMKEMYGCCWKCPVTAIRETRHALEQAL